MDRGLLIVFEGIDGCGKSTQLELLYELLCERFRTRQRPIVLTKEPTDGKVGRRIREMARSHERVTADQELEWFMEDRREHVREVIEPGLAKGAVVLSVATGFRTSPTRAPGAWTPTKFCAPIALNFPTPTSR